MSTSNLKSRIGFTQPQFNFTISVQDGKVVIPDRLIAYRTAAIIVAMIDSGIDITKIRYLSMAGESSKIHFEKTDTTGNNRHVYQQCSKIGIVVGNQMYRSEIDPTFPEKIDDQLEPLESTTVDRVLYLCNNDYSFLFHEVAQSLTIAHWMSGERLSLIYQTYTPNR